MNNLNSAIAAILTDAANKIGCMLIDYAAAINNSFDAAYGSCVVGHYNNGIECASIALKQLNELLQYADDVMPTADGSAWEYVRDALGSIKMDKMNKVLFKQAVIDEYALRIKRYVSPTFGTHPKLYKCYFKDGEVEDENSFAFNQLLKSGELERAELCTLGAYYYWNKELERWVLDALINPVVRPDLAKYMK